MCKVSKETWRKLDDEEEKCDKWIQEIKRVRDEQVRMYFLFRHVMLTSHCLFIIIILVLKEYTLSKVLYLGVCIHSNHLLTLALTYICVYIHRQFDLLLNQLPKYFKFLNLF